jgi:GNAT superfamily N-acetyltransferase
MADRPLAIRPLTPSRWPDLEAIFNAAGCSVARGCWCTYYRRSGGDPVLGGKARAQANRAALKALVDGGDPPGLIAYRGRQPVGWVSIAPREQYAKLARSPVMKPVDDAPVWSIVCFVVSKKARGQGVASALLQGAIAYVRECGATMLEAYPVDATRGRVTPANAFHGVQSMYEKAGFTVVATRQWNKTSPIRPIMRLTLT